MIYIMKIKIGRSDEIEKQKNNKEQMIGPSSFTPLPPNLPLTPTAFTYSYDTNSYIHLFNASARSKNHTEPLGTRLSLISISPRGARHINYSIINIIIIIIMDRPTPCY